MTETAKRTARALDAIAAYFRDHPSPDGTQAHECLVAVRDLLERSDAPIRPRSPRPWRSPRPMIR